MFDNCRHDGPYGSGAQNLRLEFTSDGKADENSEDKPNIKSKAVVVQEIPGPTVLPYWGKVVEATVADFVIPALKVLLP